MIWCRDMAAERSRGVGSKWKKSGQKLQPKVNQVTLFLPTAFRQCAKIAVKQKLHGPSHPCPTVTQLTKHFHCTNGTVGSVQCEKNRAGWPRRLRGLGSQLETACLPSGMQLDALDCFFCCAHSHSLSLSISILVPLATPSCPSPPPSPSAEAPLHRCWNHYTDRPTPVQLFKRHAACQRTAL